MVGSDKVYNMIRYIICSCHLNTIYHMALDNLSTLHGSEFIMRIDRSFLVFSKIKRILHLTYIMIECPYTNQHGIGSYGQCTGLSQIGHLQGVLERTGAFSESSLNNLLCVSESSKRDTLDTKPNIFSYI